MSLGSCERALVSLADGSVVDSIIGYRAWEFSARDGRAKLRSLHVDDVYWSDEPMRAVCRCRGRAGYDANGTMIPGACRDNCGIYAWREPPRAMLAAASKVWGTIYMWGDVVVHEKIIRAEYARIAGFYPIGYQRQRRLVELAGAQFGVPMLQVPESTRAIYARMDESFKTMSALRSQLS